MSLPIRVRAVLAGALLCFACGGQDTQLPADRSSTLIRECAEPCPEIRMRPVAVVGDSGDAVLPRQMTMLAGGDGFIAAGLIAERGLVALYDTTGRQYAIVGRYGGGPEEFGLPMPHPGPDGTVWVVDIDNQRISEIDARGSFLRAIPFTGAIHQALPLDSGRVLVAGVLAARDPETGRTSGPVGPPYHIMRTSGIVESSFGEWEDRRGGSVAPRIVPGDSGAFLVAGGEIFGVHRLDSTGTPITTYLRDADWFPPGDAAVIDPDSPGLYELAFDRDGRLWTAIVLPTGRYVDAFDESERSSVASFDRIRDSVIEVWDLDDLRVVARGRFPSARMGFLRGTQWGYTVRQDSLGYVYFDVWAPGIEEPS